MKALMVLIMHKHMALISVEITLQKRTPGAGYTCVLNIFTALLSRLSREVALVPRPNLRWPGALVAVLTQRGQQCM